MLHSYRAPTAKAVRVSNPTTEAKSFTALSKGLLYFLTLADHTIIRIENPLITIYQVENQILLY
ncbi:hypothetical protein SAMN05444487_10145 [Marininema mesophilum]|uniref:Uncharacterized protein n=1 Tax=Marininema mesophilum TaxID=1048340 RepID=A0A1H2PZW7_9BACL|nr:hypothetical protein SAMN05444487_10145 [Marininema mesophilum]